jgi:hypothetical protein
MTSLRKDPRWIETLKLMGLPALSNAVFSVCPGNTPCF